MKTACSPQVRPSSPAHRSRSTLCVLTRDMWCCAGPVTEDDFFTWSCLISGPGNLAYHLSVVLSFEG